MCIITCIEGVPINMKVFICLDIQRSDPVRPTAILTTGKWWTRPTERVVKVIFKSCFPSLQHLTLHLLFFPILCVSIFTIEV